MSVFKQFVKSMYNPAFISQLRFQGIGKTIRYVFVLMLITSIPAGWMLASSTLSTLSQAEEVVNHDLPAFTIENGELHSDQEVPIELETSEGTFYFDPSGEIDRETLIDKGSALASLENEALLVEGSEVQSYTYDQFGEVTLSDDDLTMFVETFNDLLPIFLPLVLILMYVFTTAMKFIGITALSLFGLILKKRIQIKLTYKHIWVMSAYAVTLPTTFIALLDAIFPAVPFGFTIYWSVAIVMLALVFKKLPRPKSSKSA
ncbi:DUF1189 domain-containing protein [Salsuginibacillus kocurii]|uniref:DUF1189 domain-containing protein n=1 Tax=Salsuginibacillus kocurii TaxID=427078 RepID=UPI0003734052|nr:DUF1189 domain-containing protein [Salsuginibacillus kocurii]